MTTTKLDIGATSVEIDLTSLPTDYDDIGHVTGLGYHHQPYYPTQSGPVIEFELIDGRGLRIRPDGDQSCEAVWLDGGSTLTPAERSAELDDVMHMLWDAVNTAYQVAILPALFTATSKVLVGHLSLA